MHTLTIFGHAIPVWLVVPIIYFLWITVFWTIKKVLFKTIKAFTEKTETKLDDIFIQAADLPLNLLIFTSGGAFIEQFLPQALGTANQNLTNYFLIGFKATTIIAIVLFLDKLINALFIQYGQRYDVLRSTGGIARGFVRLLVISLGFLILLDSFGVSITPIIASLGIGSLAVALALQPTLENFFSGVQLVADRPIKVGHFIKLETGEEGYVHKIGWRSTWIRQLPNNIVVMPNSKMVNSRITNYYYPDTQQAVLVQCGVHYTSDLEQVERVTIEVAKTVQKEVQGAVEDHEPFIRYHTFNSSSIDFTVILRAKEFVDNYLIKHEFVKRLQKRFAEEGITIPFPIRAINLDQEQADKILAQNRQKG